MDKAAELKAMVEKARSSIQSQAIEAERYWGDRLGITAEDITWAIGNVVSRCAPVSAVHASTCVLAALDPCMPALVIIGTVVWTAVHVHV